MSKTSFFRSSINLNRFCSVKHSLSFNKNLNFSNLRRDLSNQTRSKIDELIKANKVLIFIKGTRSMPQCGFSRAVLQLLDLNDLPDEKFKTVNVLEDDEIRQGIKEYSEWPTIPQVYVDGEFLGGCDTMMEMHRTGELNKILKSKKII